ncbi:hypothetical protein [Nocardioides sp.]|uniref:hypothetical protein n=1 Tax=Nocardioides sp. TaxID=35761 RepID=UPI003561F0AB
MTGRRRAPRRRPSGRRTAHGRATASVLLLGLALGTVALAGGCLAESEESPPAGTPSVRDGQPDLPAESPSGAGASSPITFDVAADPEGDPVSDEACAEVAGPFLSYALIDVSRPVTVDGVDLPEAVGVRLGRSWVAPRPEEGVARTGLVRGRTPTASSLEAVNWEQRRPLEGTLLGSGEWYVFTTLRVHHTGRADSLDLLWSDDLSTGVSSWTRPIEFRERCA